MYELASAAVLTVACFVELLTVLGLVIRKLVLISDLFVAVSEEALVGEGTLPQTPVSADFCLKLRI